MKHQSLQQLYHELVTQPPLTADQIQLQHRINSYRALLVYLKAGIGMIKTDNDDCSKSHLIETIDNSLQFES